MKLSVLLRLRQQIIQSAGCRRSNEISVELQFHIREICPVCHKPSVRLATIEPHPTRDDIALHNFNCLDCGPVRTRELSLRPRAAVMESAA